MARGLSVSIDTEPLTTAVRAFDQRLGDYPDMEPWIDELRELLDRGEAFEIVDEGDAFRAVPTGHFLALLEDMT